MKLKRVVTIKRHEYSIEVPAGAAVIQVNKPNGGYAIAHPHKYGANKHDAEHYYFWVEKENVDET